MKTYEKIRNYVKSTGMKHYILAERCNMSPKIFSQIINGRRPISEKDIVKLCKGLDVTPNDLIAYGEDESA